MQKKTLVKKDFSLCSTVKNSPRNNPPNSFWPNTRGARDRRRNILFDQSCPRLRSPTEMNIPAAGTFFLISLIPCKH